MSEELNSAIAAQGIKIRDMKAAKAAKEALDVEVASLLALKKQFKEATGKDWAPAKAPATTPPPAPAAEKKKKGEDNKKADGGGKGGAGEKEKDKKNDKKKAEASAAEPAAVFKAPKGMMFYPSLMDSSENMKVWLLASESKVNMATAESGAVAPPVPRLPAICDKNGTQVRFGANAICKYLEEVATAGGESKNEDALFELEEGVLAAGAKDAAAAASLLKQLDLLCKGGLSTAVQCVLYPSVKRVAAQAAGTSGASATIIATVEAFASFKSVSEKCQANLEELDGFDYRSAGLLTSLKLVFSHAIVTAFPQAVGLNIYDAVIVRCTNPAFGDFQCNNSMSISKALKVSCGKCTCTFPFFCLPVYLCSCAYLFDACIDDRR
jgi:hypothetical protein